MNENRPLQTTIDASCETLEATAAMMDVSLTKEMASVESLEEILKALVDLGDESALKGAIFMVGAYLGEIIRTRIGGVWESSGGILLLRVDSSTYAPVEKVKKFTSAPQNGDGLVFYAQSIFAAHVQPGAPADAR